MHFLQENLFIIAIFADVIALCYLLEAIFGKKTWRTAANLTAVVNLIAHLCLFAFFLLGGAGMEELLLVLLISLAVGLVRKGGTE